jgi:ubiquitin-protein ligase E3 C
LFLETPDRLLYPNPYSHRASENHLGHFEFLGRVIGKAMYEGILVEVPFANFFLYVHLHLMLKSSYLFLLSSSRSAKLLSKFNYYNDLVFLDPELHRNMMILKHYDGNVEEDFSLNFTVTDIVFGAVEVRASDLLVPLWCLC